MHLRSVGKFIAYNIGYFIAILMGTFLVHRGIQSNLAGPVITGTATIFVAILIPVLLYVFDPENQEE